jgi:hypothetical protein
MQIKTALRFLLTLVRMTFIQENRAGSVISVLGHLPRNSEALSSNSSAARKSINKSNRKKKEYAAYTFI